MSPDAARYPLVTARIRRDLFLADLDKHEQRITGTIAVDLAVWKPPG
jgi:hypothetical protein